MRTPSWNGLASRGTPPQEHAVGISSAVADGEDHDLGRKMPRAGQDTSQPAVLEIEVLDPARESYLPAHLLELAPEGAHDQRQPVRPEVGAMLVEDGRLAVAFGQNFQDPQHVGPGIARGELAVAEGAGPSPLRRDSCFPGRASPPRRTGGRRPRVPSQHGRVPGSRGGSRARPRGSRRSDRPGPAPMITGRWSKGREPGSGHQNRSGTKGWTSGPSQDRTCRASRSGTSTSIAYMKWRSSWRRASRLLRRMCQCSTASRSRPRRLAALRGGPPPDHRAPAECY